MLNSKENDQWKHFSTNEVMDCVNRLSAGLLRLGLSGQSMTPETQDKIAVISKNRPEWLMLDLACQQIGVLLCPIYPTTHPNEIEFIFNDAQVKYVFYSGEDILQKLNTVKSNVPSLQQIFSFDASSNATHWTTLTQYNEPQDQQAVATWKERIQPEHCVTIIYTSGTTGFPKGVMLSHLNLVSNVMNATASFPFPEMPEGKALSFLPLNHIFERMASYIYIYSGISIYYAESMETIGENLKEVKPVLFTTVPRLLEKVFDKIMQKGAELKGIKKKLFYWSVGLAERYDNLEKGSLLYRIQLSLANRIVFKKWREALGGNVQYILTGGAACQEKLLRIFNAANIPVYEGYGPTENSPVISVNCRTKQGSMYGSVGLVIQGQQVKLLDDGEICVKGPSVMMGYYKRPDLTEEVIRNGWLHTGDIGVWVNNKYLKITDRKKELFKTSGGKYIAPQYLENKLKESPYIEQVMVVGENQRFVAALIVPAFSNLPKQTDQTPLSVDGGINDFFQEIIDNYNKGFNHVEQIRKFALLSNEWTVETGELTPKLSMRRKVISEKYKKEIEGLFL